MTINRREEIEEMINYCDEIPAPRCWEAKGALLALCMRIAALEDALTDSKGREL